MSGLFCQDPKTVDCVDYQVISENNKTVIKRDNKIYIHPICNEVLSKNCRKSYQEISEKINKNKSFHFNIENSKNRIFKFENTAITNNGIIITENKYYFNGGCYKEYDINKEKVFKYREYLKNNSKKYKKVISITELWGDGVWHFPLECLVALKNITDLNDTYLHITKKTNLCLQWIDCIGLNIDNKKIIDGDIFADTLIIPEMGGCGNVKLDLLLWLKKNTLKQIDLSNSQNKLILIKRNYSRTVKNHDDIMKICKQFCLDNNLIFYLHDDTNLPTLKQQLSIFNTAKIIIGPHGAGAINLLTCKRNTHFIEFLPISQNLMNICYIKLSDYLNINYYGIPYKINDSVNLTYITEQLDKAIN